MIHALAASLALDVPQLIRRPPGGHRFVRWTSNVTFAGLRGTSVSLIDLTTGRSVDRVRAGPLSSSSGFDGETVWSTDASGMPLIEGSADARLDAMANAHFIGRRGPERALAAGAGSTPTTVRIHVRFNALSGPIDVFVERASGRILRIVDDTGGEASDERFADYRRIDGVELPYTSESHTRYGDSQERIHSVDFPVRVADDAFAPPEAPDDVTASGTVSLPMMPGYHVPVVPIRIGNGPVLHVLFDTGGSNTLSPAAARRLHLRLVGNDLTGGIGPDVVRTRYVQVAGVHLGAAVVRNQTFAVLDSGAFPGTDGIIGCEMLLRFAARFDFRARRVDLARDVDTFGITKPPIPMRLSGCQPQIDGALDGMRGPIAIDTGSGADLDVMSPFVAQRGLLGRYTLLGPGGGRGIGGWSYAYLARAKRVELGTTVFQNAPIELNVGTAGAFHDPAQLGNAGVHLFGTKTAVFDYSGGRMWLLSP